MTDDFSTANFEVEILVRLAFDFNTNRVLARSLQQIGIVEDLSALVRRKRKRFFSRLPFGPCDCSLSCYGNDFIALQESDIHFAGSGSGREYHFPRPCVEFQRSHIGFS